MLHLNMKRFVWTTIVLAFMGCYGEGESVYLGRGETRKYLTIEHCEEEATSRYGDGSIRYSGFECRDQIFGLTASIRRYKNGELVAGRESTVVEMLDALTPYEDTKPAVYRLYRSSMVLKDARLHVATFDAETGEEYNRENCDIARDLFVGQPGVMVRYWCELS